MILVLANQSDSAARSFVTFAKEAGISCIIPDDPGEIELDVETSRMGEVKVELTEAKTSIPITGVLNRGLPVEEKDRQGSKFQFSELLASWWSALAYFSGPVINRPSKKGFLPNPEPLDFADSRIELAAKYVASGKFAYHPVNQLNVHQVSTGGFVLRTTDLLKEKLSEHDLYYFTDFDPDKTIHLLKAGHSIIDLADPHKDVTSALDPKLSSLFKLLDSYSAFFSLIVLEPAQGGFSLVHVSPFPMLGQYRHLSDQVNHSLLNYLTHDTLYRIGC